MADPAPRVSIVMPARNAAATIGEAIDSVQAQDWRDWELIVIDDKSSDATARLVTERAAADPRIRLIAGAGEGASAARNRGIHAAIGDRLAFLDSDDWWDADFLSTMLAALNGQPDNTIPYCSYRRVMPDGSQTEPRINTAVEYAPFPAFALSCQVAIHAVLLDRARVAEAGGFDTALVTCEDWDLWQRLARGGAHWVRVDRALAYYRTATGTLSRSPHQMIADARIVIDRAQHADPRVPDAIPQFAQGLTLATRLQSPEEALAWFMQWTLVVGRLDGDDLPIDPAPLAALPQSSHWTKAISANILDAAAVGLNLTIPAMAAEWPRLAPTVRWIIAQIAAAWNDPAAETRLLYALEEFVAVASYDDPVARVLDKTMRVHVDIGAPRALALPEGVDRVYAVFTRQGHIIETRMIGALGTITPSDWRRMILQEAALHEIAHETRRADPFTLAPPAAVALARQVMREPGILVSPGRARSAVQSAMRDGVRKLATDRSPADDTHGGQLGMIVRSAQNEAARLVVDTSPATSTSAPREAARDGDRRAFWEDYFENEDPWNYGSPYEQEKYQRQIALLPEGHIGRALELASAEGFFSRLLAPRVERLISTDISTKAVERASKRCAGFGNIDWRTLDLAADPIPDGMDLIVCSEVLYYLDDAEELARVTRRLADALAPGGSILTAHAFVLTDDSTRTGFDWGNPYGAQRIVETFAAIPGLVLDATIETELYRIDRFRKGEVREEATHSRMTIDAPIELSVARSIVWNGATTTRADAMARERTERLPILMYHAVAPDGPEALARWRLSPEQFRDQLRWLRSNGYQGLTSPEVAWYLRTHTPFYGRPVWITFDDGNQNFAEHAWPLLRAHDFPAEMFVVTGMLGGTAEWDAAHGDPLPLMDGTTIARLAAEGARFGSHFHQHRAADALSSHELAVELAQSRATIARLTGEAPHAFATPYTIADARLPAMAEEQGYTLGFASETGCATLNSAPRDLPRIEVRGDMTLDSFAAMLEGTRA